MIHVLLGIFSWMQYIKKTLNFNLLGRRKMPLKLCAWQSKVMLSAWRLLPCAAMTEKLKVWLNGLFHIIPTWDLLIGTQPSFTRKATAPMDQMSHPVSLLYAVKTSQLPMVSGGPRVSLHVSFSKRKHDSNSAYVRFTSMTSMKHALVCLFSPRHKQAALGRSPPPPLGYLLLFLHSPR